MIFCLLRQTKQKQKQKYLVSAAFRSGSRAKVVGACRAVRRLTCVSSASSSRRVLSLVLPLRYASTDAAIQKAALGALSALAAARDDEELSEHIPTIRSVVSGLRSNMKHKANRAPGPLLLPGLCQKNGLKPLLPMFQHALLKGTPVMREHAAAGIGELICLTSPDALKPFIIKLTGPLIRIMHDRFPRGVKIAILDTLISLIDMGGARLRPFLPQLQTTFVKVRPPSPVRSSVTAVALYHRSGAPRSRERQQRVHSLAPSLTVSSPNRHRHLSPRLLFLRRRWRTRKAPSAHRASRPSRLSSS